MKLRILPESDNLSKSRALVINCNDMYYTYMSSVNFRDDCKFETQ